MEHITFSGQDCYITGVNNPVLAAMFAAGIEPQFNASHSNANNVAAPIQATGITTSSSYKGR